MRTDAVIAAAGADSPRSLPTDLLHRSVRNVRAASLVLGSLWLLGFFMNEVVFRLWFATPGASIPFPIGPGRAIGIAGFLITAIVLYLTHRLSPRRVLDLGLAHEVASCALIAMLTYVQPTGLGLHMSWIVVIILAYPVIAPATPKKTIAAGLVAACTGPLALWWAVLRGADLPHPPFVLIWYFLPGYVGALLAVLPTAIIRRLSNQVQSARDLGSYRLGRLIGTGGMGEVYHATHRLLARPAAIKLIRPDVLARRSADRQRTAIERFRREAQAASSLRSPHTIELYDFGISEDGVFYYVMELLDGVDLDALVERFGPVPPERAIHLLRQACDSLAEAHSRGLMHRDIKPSNIQTCRMGLALDFVKLLDFGLVKPMPQYAAGVPSLTAADAPGAPGTPGYMSPESVFNDPVPDHRSDIYSLGCVAYWLLTGNLVFEGSTTAKILTQHVESQPVAPSRRVASPIPAELDALVMACLAKQPRLRPASAAELSQRLAACPVAEPWTPERAKAWWEQHLPNEGGLHQTLEPGDFHVDLTAASPSA
jgi:tRNA A-37 threonylcarbamoyl transferase component Bud32